MQVRTRFAPSPTGFMHLGNLRTALYTYLYARHTGGKFILRIEDTDQVREVPGAVDVIYNSLSTAGISHDEGPDVGGPCAPYIQSQRRDTYLPYAQQLVKSGHAYYCFCTKEQLEQAHAEADKKGETYKYDKRCLRLSPEEVQRRLDAGESYVIRQNIPTEGKAGFDDVIYGHVEVDCATLDDNVLIKADGLPTYNFANVIDDHLMGITHVMRGNEYLSSTPKYNLLYEALGWTPPTYVHLTPVMVDGTYRDKKTGKYLMVTDEDGNPVLDEQGNPVKAIVHRKMSKSQGDPSFEDLLKEGFLPEAIVNYMALLGWSPKDDREFFSLSELEELFTLEGLNNSPSTFDMNKLIWFNTEYIRNLPPEEYLKLAAPWFDKVLAGRNIDYSRLAELMQSRTDVFSCIPEKIAFFAEMPDYDTAIFFNKKQKSDETVAKEVLPLLLPVLESISDWTEQNIHDVVMEKIQEWGRKNGSVLWPMRISISGQESTPGGAFEIAYLLGKDETLRRMKASLAKLG